MVLAVVFLLTFGGCTTVDDTLGSNLVPENQQMRAGFTSFPSKADELNPKKLVETRLFQTDSIIGSNITYGYMGSMLDDTLGLRSVGFLSQYINFYKVDEGYFGYRPIFDSAQIMLSIKSYGGDTTTAQRFAVYEITSNEYLTEKPISPGKTKRDTVFYLNFNPETANPNKTSILGDKLFTFELGNTTGPATKTVTMTPTPAGKQYIRRLMLQEGKYKDDYSIYSPDSTAQWVDEFKGLYIRPDAEQTTPGQGAIYSTKLDASGLAVYGRNRVEADPSLIKDTIGMVYFFYDSYAKHGNVSVNTVRHDYSLATSAAQINIADAVETNSDRPENPRAYVAGLGGVTTELSFTKAFFEELEGILNDPKNDGFNTLAFSQARISIYFPGSDYDWSKIDPSTAGKLIDAMIDAPNRLGLYTDYKRLAPIADYAYVYEQTYSTTLAYGGYINRSRGSYVMDITGYMQGLWNSYEKEAKAAKAEDRAVDLSKVKNRSIYLAPDAYNLFTPAFAVLQGQTTGETTTTLNNAPIRIDLAYNMLK